MAKLNDKEVFFVKYCEICKHKDKPETEDPCNDCLSQPSNKGSHKPVNWEER